MLFQRNASGYLILFYGFKVDNIEKADAILHNVPIGQNKLSCIWHKIWTFQISTWEITTCMDRLLGDVFYNNQLIMI